MSDLRELYQQVILDHNKNPRNITSCQRNAGRGRLQPALRDHYKVFVEIDGETIKDIGFTGNGCAISKASASVMSSSLKGKTREEAHQLFDVFHKLVTGEPGSLSTAELGRLAAFSGVSEFPARVKL